MKPMLFNTEMIKAIWDNRKTVTRRLVKDAMPDWDLVELATNPDQTRVRKDGEMYPHKVKGVYAVFDEDCSIDFPMVKVPYQPGDILYVRETWAENGYYDEFPWETERYIYKADCYKAGCEFQLLTPNWFRGWRSSIHMPKEAARIFLRVTDVRVERLKEITVEGILQEGLDVELPPICKSSVDGSFPNDKERERMDNMSEEERDEYIQDRARHTYMGWCCYVDRLFRSFENTWNSTIKKADLDKYGWNANPWVFVIKFERISKEEAIDNE